MASPRATPARRTRSHGPVTPPVPLTTPARKPRGVTAATTSKKPRVADADATDTAALERTAPRKRSKAVQEEEADAPATVTPTPMGKKKGTAATPKATEETADAADAVPSTVKKARGNAAAAVTPDVIVTALAKQAEARTEPRGKASKTDEALTRTEPRKARRAKQADVHEDKVAEADHATPTPMARRGKATAEATTPAAELAVGARPTPSKSAGKADVSSTPTAESRKQSPATAATPASESRKQTPAKAATPASQSHKRTAAELEPEPPVRPIAVVLRRFARPLLTASCGAIH